MSLKSCRSPSRFGFVGEHGRIFLSPLIAIGFGFVNHRGGRHLGFGSSTRVGFPFGLGFISEGGSLSRFSVWASGLGFINES